MIRSCCLGLVMLTALVGCSEQKPAVKAEPVAAAAAVDPDANLAPNQKLALASLAGAAVVDRVVGEAQKAARANPGKDESWVLLGRAWVRKARESADPGFYLNADACAGVVLERNAEDRPALDLRGLVLLNGHKFDEARTLGVRITDKYPEDPMAWGTLSDAYLEMGRYEEATDAVQKMVDLKPNLPSYSRASHLQFLRGDLLSARESVRRAIDSGRAGKSDPEPGAWALVQAAQMFWSQGDFDGADAGFDRALERVSDYAPANVGKGRVAIAKGDPKRAAELFERAWKVSPLVETAWLLGDARQAAGDATGANEAYASVEREGKRTDPRTLSMFYSAHAREPAEALRLAQEEYAVRRDIVTEDAVAWALYRNGKVEDAKASIARARRLGTPDARIIFHEGAIRIAAGDTAKGMALVKAALTMNPAFDLYGAREAKAILEQRLALR